MDALSTELVQLLGLGFADLPREAVLARLLARPPGARFAYVVTPNADHLQRLRRQPGLRPAYEHAALCLLDLRFVAGLARALGLAVPPVVTGAGLTASLLPHLAGQRVAIIGMRPAALAALAARYPEILFLHHDAPMGLLRNPASFRAARDFAAAARAPFTFFALGSPAQELLAHEVAQQIRPWGWGYAWVRRWSSPPAQGAGRRYGCAASGWNGSTG